MEVRELVLDHAWKWFELHASQRMQSVSFFLVATAFLSGAYVGALRVAQGEVAFVVGLVGLLASIVFSRLESRTRQLVDAGEHVIRIVQQSLANESGIPEVEILEKVETPKKGASSYHDVFRGLYGLTAVSFCGGAVYAAAVAFF